MNERPASPMMVEPAILRIVAPNPSPYTFHGTNCFVVGEEEVIVIDPGPDLPDHIEALVDAIAGRPVAAISCTHTHRDHSPAARPLSARTGAPIVGCPALILFDGGPRADAGFDDTYSPDRVLVDGEVIAFDRGRQLEAVATPGHTSNHLCFALGDVLFTGDHVMGWSTTVVLPPDGDMGDYMRSLDKLRLRTDRIYLPAHGDAVSRPQQLVRGMIGHRMQRERQFMRQLGDGPRKIPDMVAASYPGLDPRLVPAAAGSVLAHLLDLARRGLVERGEGETWKLLTDPPA